MKTQNEMRGEFEKLEGIKTHLEHGGYDDLTHVINILKGNKND